MSPLWTPSREVVFRVRVVRAKLCASYPANRGLASDPCRTDAAAVAVAPASALAVAPVVSRWCPGGVPVVSPVVSSAVSRWCPGGVSVVSRRCPAVPAGVLAGVPVGVPAGVLAGVLPSFRCPSGVSAEIYE